MFPSLAVRGHSTPLLLERGPGREVRRLAHHRWSLGAALAARDHRRASPVGGVGDLAVEAVKAFVHVDLSPPLYRSHRADSLADPASRAALRMPPLPN